EPDGAGVARLEVREPAAQRPRVVLAQALDVAHLEARVLERGDDVADLMELAVREDVALDEHRGVGARRGDGGPPDAVVQEAAAGAQQLEEPAAVLVEAVAPDVLVHADRADRIVGSVRDVAVVLQAELDLRRDAPAGGASQRELELAARERDADGARAV